MKSLLLKVLPIVLAVVVLQMVATADSQAAPPAWGCGSGGTHYVVCYGDTLFSIGRQFGVDPYYIAHVNGIPNPNHIYAGQVIYIPEGGPGYPWPQPVNCGWPCQRPPWPRPVNCGWPCPPSHPQPLPSHCGQDCGPWPAPHGYDQTGYWHGGYDGGYNRHYKQYNPTCGDNYNCY
jgi:LysM repeat protein